MSEITLEELLKLNPHLRREEILRMLDQSAHGSSVVASPKRRMTIPDRLSVGDQSRARKVKLRYTL